MKKYLLLMSTAAFMLASCNQDELKKLNEEKQKLMMEANTKDSTINDLIQSFNDIENNLAVIKEKENVIEVKTKSGSEFKEDTREKIKADIQVINDLMAQNKKQVSELQSKLKNSGVKLSEFQKMIDHLQQSINEKDAEINSLKEQLLALNFTVETLNQSVDTLTKKTQEQSDVIAQQTSDMNTAYYIIGTKKDLKEKGVVTKEGGFIGIGTVKKLSATANKNAFTRIDITKVNSFELTGHKAKLITSHPDGSYRFDPNEKEADKLIISNPGKFWETSKYLVILVD